MRAIIYFVIIVALIVIFYFVLRDHVMLFMYIIVSFIATGFVVAIWEKAKELARKKDH